jgi:hypothetical protein
MVMLLRRLALMGEIPQIVTAVTLLALVAVLIAVTR